MLPLALSNGEAILVIVLAAIPIVALSFLGAGGALAQIGKGPLSIPEQPPDKGGSGGASGAIREAEIRQLLEAKAYRQSARGEKPLDVEAELERILEADRAPVADPGLEAEVRQLVEASNARRIRMGREPLDVESEVRRQLDELT